MQPLREPTLAEIEDRASDAAAMVTRQQEAWALQARGGPPHPDGPRAARRAALHRRNRTRGQAP